MSVPAERPDHESDSISSSGVGSFFVTGGTVPTDAVSYVTRRADRELLDSLLAGEYCYVLNTRQMGKSSLSVRTIGRLHEQGVHTVFLDLTRIGGQNATPDHWYTGLMSETGRALGLRSEFIAYARENRDQTQVLRLLGAIREVALPHIKGPLVVFVDEVDAVRSLPFPTDEFFAAIRECYTARATDPRMKRLTFCLLGVATPADLISDTRMSPFNIGQRIHLRDFTPDEAAPLARGLGRGGEALLARILYWTSGHPYLTQRLCRTALETGVTGADELDRLCHDLFLTRTAQETDDNLAFVRNRLLKSEADLSALLDLYRRMRAGKRVPDDETNPLCAILKLSGVAKVDGGLLRVRNRIYAHVFDKAWVETHLPDAEKRRQAAAYRRGLLRATTIAGAVAAAMVVLSLVAFGNARRAQKNAQEARNAAVRLRRNLYAADMNAAQQALEEDNLVRAQSLLEPYRPKPGEDDLRTFEWRYLWKMSRDQSRWSLGSPENPVQAPAFSPDSRIVAVAQRQDTSQDRIVLLDTVTGREVGSLGVLKTTVRTLVFSLDGKTLAARCRNKTVALFDVATRQQIGSIPAPRADLPQADVTFSPDSKMLAITGEYDGTGRVAGPVKLWDIAARRVVSTYAGQNFVAFSPDGRRLVTRMGGYGGVALWDIAARRKRLLLPAPADAICAAFSPDSRVVAAGFHGGAIRLWDTDTGRVLKATPKGHRDWVYSVAFSPDGKRLASASVDSTLRLWETATGRELRILRGHHGQIVSVAFSPDGKTLISSGDHSDVKCWDTAPESGEDRVGGSWATLSPDGKTLAAKGPGEGATLRDMDTLRTSSLIPPREKTWMWLLGFSGDGKIVYLWVGPHGRIVFWDIAARQEIGSIAAIGIESNYRLSPDGKLLAACSFTLDRPLRIFDLAGRRELKSLQGRWAAFSADNRWLAVSRWDGTFRVWDTRTWKAVSPTLRSAAADTDGPLAFSPNGRQLLTGSGMGRLNVWDTASWTRLQPPFQAHSGGLVNIFFSPDGRTVITSADGPVAKLWNTATWRQTLALPCGDSFFAAHFTPDGKNLVITNDSTRLWRAASLAEADAPRALLPSPESIRPRRTECANRVRRTGEFIGDA